MRGLVLDAASEPGLRQRITRLFARGRSRTQDAPRSPSGRWLEAMGQLENAVLEAPRLLRLEGWVGSPRGGATRLEVSAGGAPLAVSGVQLGLPSPGVARFVPNLGNAATAAFRAHVPLDETGLEGLRGRLLRVTPWFGDTAGLDLLGVAAPLVEPPTFEELGLVSAGLPVAFEYLNYFLEFCELRPAAQVLDVGCGVGRMAYALAHHLTPPGRYEGFDVVAQCIDLAQRRFGELPHFRFQRVDVVNRHYNPGGAQSAESFAFPYPDASFDLVFLASVFTHMRPSDVRHYLGEIRRVLRPGGHCLATAFLIDGEARRGLAGGRAPLPLRHPLEDFFVVDPARPEAAIGYPEEVFLDWVRARGFTVEALLRGCWSGRAGFTSYQDGLVLRSPGGR